MNKEVRPRATLHIRDWRSAVPLCDDHESVIAKWHEALESGHKTIGVLIYADEDIEHGEFLVERIECVMEVTQSVWRKRQEDEMADEHTRAEIESKINEALRFGGHDEEAA